MSPSSRRARWLLIGAVLLLPAALAQPASAQAPANDNFASATVLTGSSGAPSATNTMATKEAGEPDHASNEGGASVWFAWTPDTSGIANVATCTVSFDTLLAVYTGAERRGADARRRERRRVRARHRRQPALLRGDVRRDLSHRGRRLRG